jgi:hypothetical protein
MLIGTALVAGCSFCFLNQPASVSQHGQSVQVLTVALSLSTATTEVEPVAHLILDVEIQPEEEEVEEAPTEVVLAIAEEAPHAVVLAIAEEAPHAASLITEDIQEATIYFIRESIYYCRYYPDV